MYYTLYQLTSFFNAVVFVHTSKIRRQN